MAITFSATRSIPKSTKVRVRIVTDGGRLRLPAVGQRDDGSLARRLHHVPVGQHQAIGGEHHAGAGAATRGDPDHGRAHPVHGRDDRVRVGIEEGSVGGIGVRLGERHTASLVRRRRGRPDPNG